MLPVVPTAAPPTPSTVGFGEAVLMLTTLPAIGAAPPDQLVPAVQSVLVVPFQLTWAAAELTERAVSIVADTLARSKRSNRDLLLLDWDCRLRFGMSRRVPFDTRRMVAVPMHSRMEHYSSSCYCPAAAARSKRFACSG